MRRRQFLTRTCAAVAALAPGMPRLPVRGRAAPWLLVPMDDAQADHLKAYGLAFRLLERGGKAEWFLNHRGGAFLLPPTAPPAATPHSPGSPPSRSMTAGWCRLRGEIQNGNMDAVPLEKAPKVAVYAPPNAAPWDDAVTMALNYAGIRFEKIWDAEVMGDGLRRYDWLHLHHEDFTGQYSKFFLNYAGAPWLAEMVEQNRAMARSLGLPVRPRREAGGCRGRSAGTSSGAGSCSRCARPPRRSTSRSPRRAWISPRPMRTARRWT